MRIITSTIALLLSTLTISATDFETATEAVRNMGVGWNLGNTLEARDSKTCPQRPVGATTSPSPRC